jgi:hypothetical protein
VSATPWFGYFDFAVLALVVLVGLIAFFIMLPELIRYLKMKAM